MASAPAQNLLELEVTLRKQVQSGDYRCVTVLHRRTCSADFATNKTLFLELAVCKMLREECALKPGEAPATRRRRVAALVDAGALELAAAVATARVGVNAAAALEACALLKALLSYEVVSTAALQRCATPEVNAVNAMLRVVTYGGLDWLVQAVPVEHLATLALAYDALMGAANACVIGPPHKLAACSLLIGEMPLHDGLMVLITAAAGKLHHVAARHALHAKAWLVHCEQPKDAELMASLWRLLRSAGRAFRWISSGSLFVQNIPDFAGRGVIQAREGIAEMMIDSPDDDELQNWGLTYLFLPLVLAYRQLDFPAEDSTAHLTSFCSCCVDISTALHPDGVALLCSLNAFKLATTAARLHASCVRPAARLMTWVAVHCPQAQRILNELGAPDVLRRAMRRCAPQRTRRGASAPLTDTASAAGAVADADNEDESDGERLSEWGDDEGPPPNRAGEASTQALVAQALRAIAGDVDVSAAGHAAAAAAADAAAAALLAELDGEKDKAAAAASRRKSKNTKKKGAKGKAALNESSGSATAACDESAGAGAAAGGEPNATQPLSAQRRPTSSMPAPAAVPLLHHSAGGDAACSGPQPRAAAPPSTDATVAEALFPWLSLADASGGSQDGAPPAMPENAPHEDDDHLCVICLDAPRDTSLAGCVDTHPAALCAACARRLLAAGGAPTCPLCRAPATPL